MKPLITQFFKYLEDIGEQKIPLNIKFLNPDYFFSTPEDLTIEGDVFLNNLRITSLPNNLIVKGYLDISGTKITSLPKGLKVGDGLNLSNTRISSLPKDLELKGSLEINNNSSLFNKSYDEIYQMAPKIRNVPIYNGY